MVSFEKIGVIMKLQKICKHLIKKYINKQIDRGRKNGKTKYIRDECSGRPG